MSFFLPGRVNGARVGVFSLLFLLSLSWVGVAFSQVAPLDIDSATQSSTRSGGVASRAIDGNTNGIYRNRSVTHTDRDTQAWWTADLGQLANLAEVEVYNRTDCCRARLSNFHVLVSATPFSSNSLDANLNDPSVWSFFHSGALSGDSVSIPVAADGRYVRIQLQGRNFLSLAEVIVSGVPLTTQAPNNPPVAVNDAATVESGLTVTIDVLGNDSDADSTGALTVTLPSGSTTNGQAVVQSNGAIQFTAAAGITAEIEDSFTYTVTDSDGDSSTATVTVTITPAIPVVDGLVTLAPVSASQSTTGFGGVASRAIDGNTAGNSFTHTALETQPWWTADLGVLANVVEVEIHNRTTCCRNRLSDFHVLVSATPFSSNSLDANLNDPSVWSFFHSGALSGDSVAIPVAADGRYVRIQLQGRNYLSLAEVSVSGVPLTTEVPNIPPVAVNDTATVESGSTVTIDVLGNDSDADSTGALTVTLPSGSTTNGQAVVQSNGAIQFTTAAGITAEVEDSFTYTVTDSDGDSSTATVTVTITPAIPVVDGLVTLAPVSASQSTTGFGGVASRAVDGNTAGNSFTHTALETQPWWTADLGVLANVVEVEIYNRTTCCRNRLSDFHVLVSATPFSSNSLDANLNDPSIWSYFHPGALSGDSVSIPVVADGRYVRIQLQGRNYLSLAEVTVSGVPIPNVAPTAVASVDQSVVVAGTDITLSASQSRDTDGSIVSYVWTDNNGAELGVGEVVTLVDLGVGSYTVNLLVTDNGGATATSSVSFTVTTVPVNIPFAAVDDVGSVENGTAVIDILANDTGDIDPTTVATYIPRQPTKGFIEIDSQTGEITYTPYTGVAGIDTYGYTVRNTSGELSNVAIATIFIDTNGDALAANDDAATVNNGSALINVLLNDSGMIDPTTVTVASSLPPQKGELQIDDQSGAITYLPDSGATGVDSFGYTVEDVDGAVSNIATVNVTITTGTQGTIAANDDVANVANDDAVTINILENDAGAVVAETVTLVTAADNGSVSITNDGMAIYQHDGSNTTADSFSYTVADTSGVVSNVAFVEITISAAPPVFTPGVAEAFHRNGQTFLTWTESAASDEYHVYRHSAPIDSGNLDSAQQLTARWGALDSDTSVNKHGGPNVPGNFVIQDLGAPLTDDTGLFVYTTQPGDSATAYFAVTSVVNGVESVQSLQTTAAPVSESVSQPRDILTISVNGGKGRIYTQFMDYSNWNPTFNGYAYNYSVAFPANYDAGRSYPLLVEPHAHSEVYRFLPETEFGHEVIQLLPHDPGEILGFTHSWWYGYSADHNYATDGAVPSSGTIENFTEQRVMRAVNEMIINPGVNVDTQLIHALGHSMGGSGVLAWGMRYPSIISGVFASQPMTNYEANTIFQGEFERLWGSRSANLPIVNDGMYSEDIALYGGLINVGVWDWMNHQQQLTERRGDDFAYLMTTHGKSDTIIPWQDQGRPIVQTFTDANVGFSARYEDVGHTWVGINAVVTPLFGLGFDAEFAWKYPLDLSFPAIQNASGSSNIPPSDSGVDNHNLNIEWATLHYAFDGVGSIVDQPAQYEITIRSTSGNNQSADITPRRTQRFSVNPGTSCNWAATDRNNSQLIGAGVVEADIDSLVTVVGVPVVTGTGTRLAIDCAPTLPTVE